jgi:acetylornithine/N-succinyldiaminopimelate aminotransferase
MVGLDIDVAAGSAINAAYSQGLIVTSAGPQTLRLLPPLIITPKEIDLAVERLGAALRAL